MYSVNKYFNLIGNKMKTQEAIDHFGGIRQLAEVLKTWPQTIYQWGEYPPKGRQYELQVITDGKLVVENNISEFQP
jgi:hypothetical protein